MNSAPRFPHRTGLSAVFLCLGVGLLTAGPLDPPAGPVTATGPTGIYSLPYAISASGSYELRNDVTLAEGGTGITITADHVSLDLGNYVVSASSFGSTAIGLPGNRRGIIIRGGLLEGWSYLLNEGSEETDENVLLEDIRFTGVLGVIAPGSRAYTVRRVSLMVVDAGIEVGDWARVEGCDVFALGKARTGDGIVVGANSSVSDSRVESGRDGIRGGDASMVVGSVVQGFGDHGIRLSDSDGPAGRVDRSTATGSPAETGSVGIVARTVSFSYGASPGDGIIGDNISFSTGAGTSEGESTVGIGGTNVSYSYGSADDVGIDTYPFSWGTVTSSVGIGEQRGISAGSRGSVFNSYGFAPNTESWSIVYGIAAGLVMNSTGYINSEGSESSSGISASIVTSSFGDAGDGQNGTRSISADVGVGSFGVGDFGILGAMDIDYPYNVPTLSSP